jgi:hypothetical protein
MHPGMNRHQRPRAEQGAMNHYHRIVTNPRAPTMPVITASLTSWNVRKKRKYRSARCILAKQKKKKKNTRNKQDPSPLPCNIDAIPLGIHVSVIEDMMPTPNSEDEGTSEG